MDNISVVLVSFNNFTRAIQQHLGDDLQQSPPPKKSQALVQNGGSS